MPCISTAGEIDMVSGELSLELVRSRIFARRFTHDNTRLQSSTAYQAALDASQRMSKRKIVGGEEPNKAQRTANAHMAVASFANMFNGHITDWTIEKGIPQLYRQYPAIIQINGEELQTSILSADPLEHAEFGKSHAKKSTPCSQLETWVNMVAITSYLDEGESAFGYDEVALIASWMNQKKTDAYAAKLAKAS